MAKKREKAAPNAGADGPEREGPGQVFVEEMVEDSERRIGNLRRTRNIGEHPNTLALARGKISLAEHNDCHTYRALFEKMGRSGKDSTDIEARGGGGGTPWSQTQAEAIQAIGRLEAVMGRLNVSIVRKFCGEGFSISAAVMGSTVFCHKDGVLLRLKEALDDLGRAIRWPHTLKAQLLGSTSAHVR